MRDRGRQEQLDVHHIQEGGGRGGAVVSSLTVIRTAKGDSTRES